MFTPEFPYLVEPMRWEDVPQVMAIERVSFPLPWPERAYRYELTENKHSHYMVLRPRGMAPARGWLRWVRRWWQGRSRPPLIGYGGLWMLAGEAHISTIAVAPAWRGRGLGELLLWSMLRWAQEMNAFEATLEVRVSNRVAQNLYHKYGFEQVGRRRRYYQDNNEDAWIMTVRDFGGEAYAARLEALGAALKARLCREAEGAWAGQSGQGGL